jgi:hypothetical protein
MISDESFLWELASDGSNFYTSDVDQNAVMSFPLTAGGSGADANVAPTTYLAGSATMLEQPYGVAVDSQSGEMFVGLSNAILVFDKTDTGNVAPKRQIDYPFSAVFAMTIHGGKIFATQESAGKIVVFDEQASGSAAPLMVIGGSESGFSDVDSLAFDAAGELVAGDDIRSSISVLLVPDNGSGTENIAPIRKIEGAASAASGGPVQVVFTRGAMYTITYITNTIVSMDPNGTNVTPALSTLDLPGSPRGLLVY